ncbi:AMP-binding protein [Grimontia sp. SpTr1]|uniref:(2,3-dihydroxybenzoyl)adenylate synthase n=1 Tax=Grimontia sp. SpTr1 TaxID=2995319 RepID=UPI00248BA3F8|nr:AMP-binding protein [Grimontia sp. SpTr1]
MDIEHLEKLWTITDEQKKQIEAGYLRPTTLGDYLAQWAEEYGDRTAVIDNSTRLSYRQLNRQSNRLAAGFLKAGLKSGETAIVQLPNSASFVLVIFALFRIGVVPVLAMPAQRENDIASLCDQAEPSAYIVPDRFLGFDYVSLGEKLQSRYPKIRSLFIDGASNSHQTINTLHTDPVPLPDLNPFNTALLLLSGGTTGAPKLIPRSHSDYAYNFSTSTDVCELNESTVYLAALPVGHNFPLGCPGILGTLSVGGKVVMCRTPGSDEAFRLINEEKVTHTALVPPLVKLWLSSKEWDTTNTDSLSLLQVGGAKFDPETAKRVSPVFGCKLQQVFGMAEGLVCYTRLNDSVETILNTQGRPMSSGDEIRLVDGNGNIVADGEIGELHTRGPYTIRGYFNAESHNLTAFTKDGFYKSGDLVRKTPEGNYVVEGRVKEQINRAGEKVAIAEIEPLIEKLDAIDECVIVAVPDDELGERSCAFVTHKQNIQPPTLKELRAYLAKLGVPRFKQPDQLELAISWPLTSVGKINKKTLIEKAQFKPTSRRAG